ncbi:MAG: HEAT repeat domain-containing protein [Terriglobales bacterium]
MDVFRPPLSGPGTPPDRVSNADPRLQPTPDYGTLGPASDITPANPGAASTPPRRGARGGRSIFAIAMGILLAVFTAGLENAPWSRFFSHSPHGENAATSAHDLSQLDRLKPQKQAETLLELAVGRSNGAVEQISTRVDGWQGKLEWNSQIATLTTAALNSNDMRVRESGIEVELAAYGLAKNSASLDYLLKTADSSDHAQKIWALWALGLMGNRGVESSRVVEALSFHLKDSDPDSRRWAVEGLALAGTSETIPLLLQVMHDDAAPSVRERAACSLAESGMFTPEQRLSAVPQLLNYTDDPSLDPQTHAWAFQALGDITHQRLPHDSAAWRSWYEKQGISGQ